jgi:tyrosyl-tRNA synthetase
MTKKSVNSEVERQLEIMAEGAVDFLGREELRERLGAAIEASRPLRIKLGLDPSAPDLHLGHTVVLQKLRSFQDLGHTAILLVGDFTARIGDPSGRKKTRPALDSDAIETNAATYVDQASRVIDAERVEVRFNSEWMDRLTPADFVRLCSLYTVARLLERDDFARRYAAGEPISVHELLYPFAQAYDSVVLESDLELGGTDQTFNLLMAREIQRDYGQPPQAVLTLPILVGTDGRDKMSKSLDNAIGITEPPEEIYGKTMSIDDAVMLTYYDCLGAGAWEELRPERERLARGEGDPLAFKHALAKCLVERFHGPTAAKDAQEHFRRVFQRRQAPVDVPETAFTVGESGDCGLLDLLRDLGFAQSTSEGRRLVAQKAVRIDDSVVYDATLRLAPGSYRVQVGKRRFARVRLS